MRKILLSILLVLALILMALFLKNGIELGSFKIYGFQGIADKSQELTEQINLANQENDDYASAIEKMKVHVEELTENKKAYLDEIARSSEDDIRHATQTKTYTIEYLWSRVGNHATSQGVNLKMEVVNSTLQDQEYRNLNFTVTGPYLAITQFIYDIENDTNLDFTIDDFHMLSGQATFTVKDIKIYRENSTVQPSTDTTEPTTSDTTTDNSPNTQTNNESTTQDTQKSEENSENSQNNDEEQQDNNEEERNTTLEDVIDGSSEN